MDATSAIDEVIRINSLVSRSLGIGEMAADPLENLDVSERQITGSYARRLHRNLDILQRIIDSPVEDALAGRFKIKTNVDQYGVGPLIYERMEELDIYDVLGRLGVGSRLYLRGTIFYPVILEEGSRYDRTHLSRPLSMNSIVRVEELNVIPEDHFTFLAQNWDPLARGFGKVSSIYIQGALTHPSRVVHLIDNMDPYLLRGTPLLDRILTSCQAMNIAEWTITNLILRYRALVLKYPAPQAGRKTEKNWFDLQQIIDDIKMKFTSKSVAAVPANYEFEYLQTQFAGIKEATDFLVKYLSATTGLPQSKIIGSAEGEIASAKENKRSYNDMVESSIREKKFVPVLERTAKLILRERDTELFSVLQEHGIRPEEVTTEIVFEPLQSMTPLESAQKKLVDVQRATMEIASQVSSSTQIQQELYPEREMYEGGAPGSSDPFGLDEILKEIGELVDAGA